MPSGRPSCAGPGRPLPSTAPGATAPASRGPSWDLLLAALPGGAGAAAGPGPSSPSSGDPAAGPVPLHPDVGSAVPAGSSVSPQPGSALRTPGSASPRATSRLRSASPACVGPALRAPRRGPRRAGNRCSVRPAAAPRALLGHFGRMSASGTCLDLRPMTKSPGLGRAGRPRQRRPRPRSRRAFGRKQTLARPFRVSPMGWN